MTTVVHPGDSLTPRQRLVYILVLGALTALGPFTVDLYLPAFPALESDFGVSTAVIQLTLTATAVGFGLGQLLACRPCSRQPSTLRRVSAPRSHPTS